MKLSFLAQCNILNAAVTITVFMPTMAVGGVIARVADSNPVAASDKGIPTYIMTPDEMLYWIAHTDAKLTFICDSTNSLSSCSAQTTTVTYCSTRIDNVCRGACTVYTGGAACLYALDTNCLPTTNNVGFCDGDLCDGSYNQLSSCGTPLGDGYCYTPGTNSITVSNV